jgi:acyl-CoA synthetase (AMP-forming)/AMP-acid ligase II
VSACEPDPASDAGLGVSRWVRYFARETPDELAIVCADTRSHHGVPGQVSFAELEALTERCAAGFRQLGLGPGDRVILMVEPGVAFFTLAFGLLRIGAVMVAVDPGMGIARVRRALASVQAAGFIGSPKALLARALFRWGESTVRAVITVGSTSAQTVLRVASRGRGLESARVRSVTFAELAAIGGTGDASTIDTLSGTSTTAERTANCPSGQLVQAPHQSEEHVSPRIHSATGSAPDSAAMEATGPMGEQRPGAQGAEENERDAAILFTSGSTGPPKGVLYTHALFEAQLRALKIAYNIQPGERELATFPLFALFAPALGMRAVIPAINFTKPGSADPAHLLQLIERDGITSMFGSPALLTRLLQAVKPRDARLRSVRRAVSAGAPVPIDTLTGLANALPETAEVHTPYGATEALPVTSIEAREIIAAHSKVQGPSGVCVGRPATNMDVRILPISDTTQDETALEAVATGTIGEITVAGPVVTHTYVGNEQANALAKILRGTQVFHRMGDLGYFDQQGRLWLCGRKSQRVTVEGEILHTVPCESIFNLHPRVARSALVAVYRGQDVIPVLVVELDARAPWDTPDDRAQIRGELLASAAQYRETARIEHVMFHRNFPVDPRHNAKIGREALAAWATRRL